MPLSKLPLFMELFLLIGDDTRRQLYSVLLYPYNWLPVKIYVIQKVPSTKRRNYV